MDKNLYDRGLAKRRQVLGDEYVDAALQNVNDFNREFQRVVTEYCWGEVWGDETLSPRERSILTLGMVAALGKMGEFANHVRGAQVNGLTPDELRAVLIQIAIYCGIPVGADCFQRGSRHSKQEQGKLRITTGRTNKLERFNLCPITFPALAPSLIQSSISRTSMLSLVRRVRGISF